MLAFFLAMGIGAHALDELAGRPLRTAIPSPVLVALAVVSVAAACAIGIAVALERSASGSSPLVAVGAFLVPAYNLELFGGRFHSDLWFALAWGGVPGAHRRTSRAPATVRARGGARGGVGDAALARRSAGSRRRSGGPGARSSRSSGEARARGRRRASRIERETLVAAPEAALRLLAASTVLLAAALVALASSDAL